MALVMRGTVVGVETTKGGSWQRVMIGTGRRVNDVVMVPTAAAVAVKVGGSVELPVRASVETTAEGRPTKFIVFWYEDGIRRPRNGNGDGAHPEDGHDAA